MRPQIKRPGVTRRGALQLLGGSGLAGAFCQGSGAALAADPEPEPEGAGRAADPSLGDPDAGITVIEYFSFSCSHCARFHREVFPAIRERYLETGRVRFVLRDFPLNLVALKAAQAAWCGGRERYFELVDALWAEWQSWIDLEVPDPELVRIVAARGLAPEKVEACLTDPSVEKRVLASYLRGARDHGVDRTPTFIVNGENFRGFIPLARFEHILAEAAQ